MENQLKTGEFMMTKIIASIFGALLLLTVQVGPAAAEDYNGQRNVLDGSGLWLPAGPAGKVVDAGTTILYNIWRVSGKTTFRDKVGSVIKHAAEEAGEYETEEDLWDDDIFSEDAWEKWLWGKGSQYRYFKGKWDWLGNHIISKLEDATGESVSKDDLISAIQEVKEILKAQAEAEEEEECVPKRAGPRTPAVRCD